MVTLSLHISPDIVGPIKAYLHGIPFWLWFEHFEPEGEMLWMRRALEMEQDVALERGRLTWLCIPAILISSMNFQNSSKFINHTDLFSCLSVLRIDPARLASKSTRTHIDNTARDARCLSQMSQTSQTSQTKSQKNRLYRKMLYWWYIDCILMILTPIRLLHQVLCSGGFMMMEMAGADQPSGHSDQPTLMSLIVQYFTLTHINSQISTAQKLSTGGCSGSPRLAATDWALELRCHKGERLAITGALRPSRWTSGWTHRRWTNCRELGLQILQSAELIQIDPNCAICAT